MVEYYQLNEPFDLELGGEIEKLTICFKTYGSLNEAKDNVVWVCHALTANADVMEWWPGLVGANMMLDPQKYFIICANMLGSCYGTTGPGEVNEDDGSVYGLDFPEVTIRDMVKAHQVLAKHLGIQRIYLGTGGSMGGQQILEWAIQQPELFENLCLLATNAKHSPWGIAFNESQRMALEADETLTEKHPNAGANGLEAARSIAMLSYRNYRTYLNTQSEEDNIKKDQFKASSYQRYQGEKLRKRFNAHAYWVLSKAMDSHNVARKRGSLKNALALVKAKTLVIGIKSDILFPIEEQFFLSSHIPKSHLEIIDSPFGHDGFLVEVEKIALCIRTFLATKALPKKRVFNLLTLDETAFGERLPGSESF